MSLKYFTLLSVYYNVCDLYETNKTYIKNFVMYILIYYSISILIHRYISLVLDLLNITLAV